SHGLGSDHPRRPRPQGEPRRALPRGLPRQGPPLRQGQSRRAQGARWADTTRRGAHPRDAGGAPADHPGDEVMATLEQAPPAPATTAGATPRMVTLRIWRGDAAGGKFEDYATPVSEGMVVLDAVHRVQADQANDMAVRWNCKCGRCGSCSAEINGKPR